RIAGRTITFSRLDHGPSRAVGRDARGGSHEAASASGPESGSDSLPEAIPQSQLKGSQAPPPASAELRRGRGRYSVLMIHLRSHHRPVGIERITCEPVRNKPEAPAKPIVPPSAAPSRPVNLGLGDLVLIVTCLYTAV